MERKWANAAKIPAAELTAQGLTADHTRNQNRDSNDRRSEFEGAFAYTGILTDLLPVPKSAGNFGWRGRSLDFSRHWPTQALVTDWACANHITDRKSTR